MNESNALGWLNALIFPLCSYAIYHIIRYEGFSFLAIIVISLLFFEMLLLFSALILSIAREIYIKDIKTILEERK